MRVIVQSSYLRPERPLPRPAGLLAADLFFLIPCRPAPRRLPDAVPRLSCLLAAFFFRDDEAFPAFAFRNGFGFRFSGGDSMNS